MKQAKYLITVAALLLLLVISSPASFGQSSEDSPLRFVSHQAVDNVVHVMLANDGTEAVAAMVSVAAVVDGQTVVSSASTTISAGGQSTASVGFSGRVESTEGITVHDNDNPF